jgi:hypothetical protein
MHGTMNVKNGELLVQMLRFTLTYQLAWVPRFMLNVLTAVTDVEVLSLEPCVQFRTD